MVSLPLQFLKTSVRACGSMWPQAPLDLGRYRRWVLDEPPGRHPDLTAAAVAAGVTWRKQERTGTAKDGQVTTEPIDRLLYMIAMINPNVC